jgi:hypothetical protein
MSFDVSRHDWATLTGEPHVVPAGQVGVAVATEADIGALDGKVRHLESDTDAPGQFGKMDVSLQMDWITFRAEWAKFFGDHSGGALGIPFVIQQNVTDDFVQFVARYNELLRRIKAAGVKTTATPSGPSGGEPTITDSVLGWIADKTGVSMNAAPYVLAGGVAVVGLVGWEIAQHVRSRRER